MKKEKKKRKKNLRFAKKYTTKQNKILKMINSTFASKTRDSASTMREMKASELNDDQFAHADSWPELAGQTTDASKSTKSDLVFWSTRSER